MTTQATTQEAQTVRRGRPMSKRGAEARRAVLRYAEKQSQFTPKDVIKATKKQKGVVRNQINALAREGAIVQVGTRNQEGRGRPEAVYQAVEGRSE